MIEVTGVFNCSSRTFFFAAKIMDKFFKLQPYCVHSKLLHIIGAVSILIASKYEDVRPISLIDVEEKICHKKFSADEILITEQAILKKLGFCINFVTRCDFIEEVCKELEIPENIKKLSLFVASLSMHFYSHLDYKESQAAYCSLLMVVKGMKLDEIAVKVLGKCIQSKVFLSYENFKNDILKFRESFPNLNSVFLLYQMDFDSFIESIRITSKAIS